MRLQTVKLSNLKSAPWRITDERPCQETRNVVLSLKKHGQLRPIIVRPISAEPPRIPQEYQIIDGHVVVDAARDVGLEEIACVIHSLNDEDAVLLYLHLKLNRTVRNQIKVREAFRLIGDPEKISRAICWPKERVIDYMKLGEEDDKWIKSGHGSYDDEADDDVPTFKL